MTSATGTNEFYRNCGRCGTWVKVGALCHQCGEVNRYDATPALPPANVGEYSISMPWLTEDRVREIAREEIAKVLAGKPVSCTTTDGVASYTVTSGLVCPWVHRLCEYTGRLGTRAGGGLFCQLEVNGGKRCPEGNRVLCGEGGKKA